MRKLIVKIPVHMTDRLRKYREREGIDEDIALMRLISEGLKKAEEDEIDKMIKLANTA